MRRDSRNDGRNRTVSLVSRFARLDRFGIVQRTLFGGRAGSAFFACGNASNSCRRKVSNSEYLNSIDQRESQEKGYCMNYMTYLMRMTIGPPYNQTIVSTNRTQHWKGNCVHLMSVSYNATPHSPQLRSSHVQPHDPQQQRSAPIDPDSSPNSGLPYDPPM